MLPSGDASFQSEMPKDETISPSTTGTSVDSTDRDLEAGGSPSQKQSWVTRWFSKSTGSSDASQTPRDEYSVLTRFLEARPRGYPQVATFQSSDRNFLQYRGFTYLHCRVLSDLQYELESLEMELDELDTFEMMSGKHRRVCSRRRDTFKTAEELKAEGYPPHLRRCRPHLLSKMREALLQYDHFLLHTKEMTSLQKPSNRDYESVRTWFRDNQPLVAREANFIRRKEDIVSLRSGRESAGFEGFVERCLNCVDDILQRYCKSQLVRKLFLTPELREKTDSEFVRYYAPNRVNKLVNIIITLVIFILLILPVIIMYEVTELGASQAPLDAIGVLIVFTLIFGMAVSSLTTAKRHELFAACAAYAAVLVVFIGNFGVQQVQILHE